jgi:hypothetical protein
MEAADNHHSAMHEHLLTLICQHLDIQIIILPGNKTRKTDSDSVGKYAGGARFSDLENWITDLIVMFETKLYGRPGCDRECTLHILSFLTGEAKKWHCRHVLSTNCRQLTWSFEEIILGLYN